MDEPDGHVLCGNVRCLRGREGIDCGIPSAQRTIGRSDYGQAFFGRDCMRYSIRELLLVTVIVALALGWWLDRTRTLATVEEERERSMKMEMVIMMNRWTMPADGGPAYFASPTNADSPLPLQTSLYLGSKPGELNPPTSIPVFIDPSRKNR
jgi:hypothetical protein